MEKFEFKNYTTMKIGGGAESFVKCRTLDEVFELYAYLKKENKPYLILGGGSNLLVCDEGFSGVVVQLEIKKREINIEGDQCRLLVGAGEDFDSVVAEMVSDDWSGLELLSGIPGSVGAAPIQNIGAFGAEVADIISKVHCLDTFAGEIVELGAKECLFGYRSSIFNQSEKGRYWILFVEFKLKRPELIAITYPDLKERLDCEKVKEIFPIREAVLALRRERGMVLGPNMPNSAGSFFKNPIVTSEKMKSLQQNYPQGMPCYPIGENYKVPAAWLIGQTSFIKGYQCGNVAISKYHNLCLVNLGDATFLELMNFANSIKEAVMEKFGVALEIEPEIYSCRE